MNAMRTRLLIPLAGLFLATGHYRNGILLANETARAVADAIGA